MSEREVSEKEIDDRLEELLDIPDDKEFEHLTHTIKFIALILFNLRKDFVELYKDYAEFKELVMDVVNIPKIDKRDKNNKKDVGENNDITKLYI